jgi:hypothetical protein
MKNLLEALATISKPPAKDRAQWLSSAEGSIEFLKENTRSERTVLFASMPAVLIHAVLAPLDALDPPNQDDLSQDFVAPDDRWAIEHASGGGEPDRVYLAPPMSGRSETLSRGEKLVFIRSSPWSSETPIEISQKLVHSLDLHFVEERKGYCRLNDNGDLEDVITVTQVAGENWTENVTVVSILAKDFAEYMRLAGMGMVVFFDFTRVSASFNGWRGENHFEHKARDLFYHGGAMAAHGSYVNGRMIIRPAVTIEQIVEAHKNARDSLQRNYAVFKAINLKTGERIEVSCSPSAVSNYFQPESDLPREMSPAFFRAEVLHRYKADSEKYELRDRSIYCRGTWTLRTYDINDAGQVHTYLRYLRELPYNEQLYWQSFNEWPKGPLSHRAITTDFKGEVFTGYDALNSLKRKIKNLDQRRPAWWQLRGEMAKTVHYPATRSASEWANEILALDQLVVEGFRVKELRELAQKLGGAVDKDWKSLRLLEECLAGTGMDADDAKQAISALRELHEMRSVVKGHSAAAKRRELEKQAVAGYESFRAQFTDLAARCDRALEEIINKLARETTPATQRLRKS